MRRRTLHELAALAGAAVLATNPASADVLLAQSDYDFRSHPGIQGHPDTRGSGNWEYGCTDRVGDTLRRAAWLDEFQAWGIREGAPRIWEVMQLPCAGGGAYRYSTRHWQSGVTGDIRVSLRFETAPLEGEGVTLYVSAGDPGVNMRRLATESFSGSRRVFEWECTTDIRAGQVVAFTLGPEGIRPMSWIWATIEYVCAADTDDDGEVNFADVLRVLADWGRTESDADVNGDGIVDFEDLLAVLEAWGSCL